MPRPNVDSAVIRLTPHKNPPVQAENEELMFKLIKTAFSQRRKTLLNCIFNSGEWGMSKEEIAAFLNENGFDERIRGEKLTLSDFAKLSDELNKRNK
jgi:16S rRNA (adenine1518-N6/adenine1519-N6)-dimethyltransferase